MPKYYSTSKKLPISDLKNFISLCLVFALVVCCTTKNFFSSPSEYQENKIDSDISVNNSIIDAIWHLFNSY
tara:strand:- start:292 stop:504 length:213 start_codon:yes stop_codon:yes gene_type:complete